MATGEQLGTAVLELTTDDSKLVTGMKAAEGKAGSMIGRINRAGKTMTHTLTLPIVAAGAASVKLAMDFETSMHEMSALAGVSRKQVTAWSSEVLKLAPALGKAPDELARGLYFIASSGVPAAKAMDVLKVSAKASAAGLGETETVADAVTSAMNAYKRSGLTAARATDILTATVREGKGEASAIAPVLGALLPLASELGVGFEEVGGSMAQMTRLGMPAAEAATALQAVMSGLLHPSVDSGKALKEVGLSAAGLRQQLADKGVLSVLDTLNEKFHGNTDAIARVFPNIRALRGALALAGKAGGDTAGVFDRVNNATGALNHAFAETQQTSGFKFKQTMAELQVAGITAGNLLIPIFLRVLHGVNDLASGFTQLSPHAQNLILVGLGLVAALGPVVRIVANVAQAIRGLGIAMTFLSANPIAVFLLASAAVGVGLGILIAKFSGGASAAQQYADATNRAAAATTALQGAVRSAEQADISLAQAQLEVKSAANDLQRVQKEVNNGTLKGKDASIQLEQAQLRLKSARLAVKDATDRAHEANKKETDSLVKNTHERLAAVDAAKREVQQAQASIRMTGATAENLDRLKAAKRDLKTATENATRTEATFTAGLGKAGRQAEDARNRNAELRNTMNSLKSRALSVKVDTVQALFQVVHLVGMMAQLQSKTIYVNIVKRDPHGSWNTQEAVENLRAEPKKRSFEISFKALGTPDLERSVQRGAHKIKTVITAAVREAASSARKNLADLASGISTTLQSAIDKSTASKIAALGDTPEAKRLAALNQQLDAESNARQRAQLQEAIDSAQTDQERADAQDALRTYDLEQERDALQQSLSDRADAYQKDADNRKAALDQGITDLTDALNRGLITQAQYTEALNALIAAQAPEYENLGALLGESTARGYVDAFKALMKQSGLVGFAGLFGGADSPDTISPEGVANKEAKDRAAAAKKKANDALKAKLQAQLENLRDKANNPGSPGGTAVTPAERQDIEDLMRRIRGLARGGLVRGSLGIDRAGLFALSNGEGVFRSTAMEGMQRWFEKGGGSGGVSVNFHGPVIGTGDTRSLARTIAAMVQPELDRRVGMPV